MKVILLAAGEGIRMRPLTYTRPKVMLPLVNKPILEHLLIEVRKAGIEESIFVVGYHEEQVRDYFGDGQKWGVSIKYITQRDQFGTADAIRMAYDFIDEDFLVINGDVIVANEDIRKVMYGAETTLGTTDVADARDLGVVKVGNGRVEHIYEKTEKPPSNLVNAGIYLFTLEIFNTISRTLKSPRNEYEITDTLQLLIDEGHSIGYREITRWLNLSYPWDLLSANENILKDMQPHQYGAFENNVIVKGKVSIGRDTIVRSGSYIIGPVLIGQNCDIGPNCYIRPHTSIGDNCRIGSSVEVKNSIIMQDSKIPHHNYVGDSIIGEGCNFGAGSKVANIRFDKQDIWVADIDTKRRKLGAIIGDRVEIGINACINVGSLIGNDTFIGPGAIVSGITVPNSRVF